MTSLFKPLRLLPMAMIVICAGATARASGPDPMDRHLVKHRRGQYGGQHHRAGYGSYFLESQALPALELFFSLMFAMTTL